VLGEHALGLRGEVGEQVILTPAQAHVLAVDDGGMRDGVQLKRPYAHDGGGLGGAAAQESPQAGPQLGVADGSSDRVVGAGVKGAQQRELTGGGEHEDRQRPGQPGQCAAAQVLEQVDRTARLRQPTEHDGVGRLMAGEGEGVLAGAGPADGVAVGEQLEVKNSPVGSSASMMRMCWIVAIGSPSLDGPARCGAVPRAPGTRTCANLGRGGPRRAGEHPGDARRAWEDVGRVAVASRSPAGPRWSERTSPDDPSPAVSL